MDFTQIRHTFVVDSFCRSTVQICEGVTCFENRGLCDGFDPNPSHFELPLCTPDFVRGGKKESNLTECEPVTLSLF